MQDRYVGDIGDFGKFGLLRRILGGNEFNNQVQLGIVWCLFPDETHNQDGGHISYLSQGHMRLLDPILHDCLERMVATRNRRVSEIAKSEIFPPTTVFVDKPIKVTSANGETPPPKERVTYRDAWIRDCFDATEACDIVFFDPDNGIESPSVDKRHPKAGKYIFWGELSAFARRGQSIVVYHHTNRRASVPKQIENLRPLFRERVSTTSAIVPLIFHRGSCRVFWLVLSDSLADPLQERIGEMMRSGWHHHFEFG